MSSSLNLAAGPNKNDAGKSYDVNRAVGVIPEGIEPEKNQLMVNNQSAWKVSNFTILLGTSILTFAAVAKW